MKLRLRSYLLVSVFLGVWLPFIPVLFVLVSEHEINQQEELQSYSEIISGSISETLFYYDVNNARLIASSFLKDKKLTGIRIVDEKNQLFMEIQDERTHPDTLEFSSPVLHKGDRLGVVHIYYDNQVLKEELWAMPLTIGLILLCQVAVTAILLGWVLIKKVAHPVSTLLEQSESLRQNNLEREFAWKGTDELSQIGRAFDQARQSIQDTQEHLVEQEKMASLGLLVAGVAHEMNTPAGIAVTAVSQLDQLVMKLTVESASGKLKKKEFESLLESMQECSTLIYSNLYRLQELVHSLKQTSMDQVSETCKPFEIKSYIDELALSLRASLKGTPHHLEIDCEGCVLNSYPGIFAQILTNFVNNSVMHAYDEGTKGVLKITGNLKDSGYCLEYRDDGKGMDKESVEKVFDPFFTTKRGRGGTGLGMHIVYNLITQKLRGKILLESKPDEGVKITIMLPAECMAS